MEGAHCLVGVVFFDHEAHVDFACALRNHTHINVADGVEDLRGHAVLSANIFADHADQRLAAFVLYIGQLAEVGGDERELVVRIDGKRDTDFAGRYHVDGTLVLVEDREDFAEITVGHQHATGDYVDDGKLLFDSDGFEGAAAVGSQGRDARALAGGVAAVQHIHRNVLFDCGQNGGRVQDLCAEIGKLGGFFKADDFDAQRIGADGDPWS